MHAREGPAPEKMLPGGQGGVEGVLDGEAESVALREGSAEGVERAVAEGGAESAAVKVLLPVPAPEALTLALAHAEERAVGVRGGEAESVALREGSAEKVLGAVAEGLPEGKEVEEDKGVVVRLPVPALEALPLAQAVAKCGLAVGALEAEPEAPEEALGAGPEGEGETEREAVPEPEPEGVGDSVMQRRKNLFQYVPGMQLEEADSVVQRGPGSTAGHQA